MKIGKLVFATMFAIGLGSSCAYAQIALSSAQTITATTAMFTAVVANVDKAAGKISLTQILFAKPTALHDLPTATADYVVSPVLLNTATVGAIVLATVQRINGTPAVVALNGVFAMPQIAPTATASSTTTNPAVLNPARLTPSGVP